jgi:hypothetical protein
MALHVPESIGDDSQDRAPSAIHFAARPLSPRSRPAGRPTRFRRSLACLRTICLGGGRLVATVCMTRSRGEFPDGPSPAEGIGWGTGADAIIYDEGGAVAALPRAL